MVVEDQRPSPSRRVTVTLAPARPSSPTLSIVSATRISINERPLSVYRRLMELRYDRAGRRVRKTNAAPDEKTPEVSLLPRLLLRGLHLLARGFPRFDSSPIP